MPNGFLYRWEDHNHGLEHKCGTCATVLSSPRAKKTCFGIHEEVCTRYHKTLFYVGQSHHCDACHKSIELHDKRHRQIASIIQAIQSLDGTNSPVFNRKTKAKKSEGLHFDLPDAEIETFKAVEATAVDEAGGEQREILWDDKSSTLNDQDVDDQSQPRDDANARKATKAERKAAKNQVRFDVITKEDLERIQHALHPEIRAAFEELDQGQGLFDNSTIDNNIAFNTSTFKYASLRQDIHTKRLSKSNGPHKKGDTVPSKEVEDMSASILRALGIKTKLTKVSKQRKSLDNRLRNAIKSDLVAFENEKAETMERMAGYWRYVNKRTYNQMVENNQLWDWATGQKLLKVEEENELDTIEEEDESAEDETLDGTSTGTTPATSPEKWDHNEDFDFPADGVLFFDQKINPQDGDSPKTPTQATYARNLKHPNEFGEVTNNLQQLSFSPGRSPGPTLIFRVPSPHSSDDDSYEGDWIDCDTPVLEGLSPLQANNGSTSSFFTTAPNAKRLIFDGKKDGRACDDVLFVREASPPQEPSVAPPTRWRRLGKAPSPTTIPPTHAEINNRFGNLDRELPAPCDDPKKPDETLSKVRVITIALPPKPGTPVAEDGWEQVQAGPKRNQKNFPPLDKKKKGAVKGNKQNQGKGGTTWANVVGGGGKKR